MNETTDAALIFAPLWRHKWLILLVGILAAAATYLYYNRQPSIYTATTQLYLGGGTEAQGLLNGAQGKAPVSDRAVLDQAALINSNVVSEPVRRQLLREHKLAAAHGTAKAKSTTGSDFVTISTQARTGQGAATLANAYAQMYITQRSAGYRREVKAAIAGTRQQLRRIEASQSGSSGNRPSTAVKGRNAASSAGRGGQSTSGGAGVIEAANLVSRIDQLESDLSIVRVQQISPAKAAAFPVSPRPKRSALFGFLLGVLLAAIAVYSLGRFNRRLRSLADIEAAYQMQILTALPVAGHPIIREDGRPAPAESLREPLRRLHTTLRLGGPLGQDGETSPRSILFVSADVGDGKSTLVAGLALIQCEAAERVAVVEADLRRPVQASLLDVNPQYGLAEVLAGALAVGDALQTVKGTHTQAASDGANSLGSPGGIATMVESSGASSMFVLVGGGPVANPPALLAGARMADLLRSVSEDVDRVLVDAPPPLAVSDAMPLLAAVDGIVIVARVGHTRQTSARRLLQLLERASSAPVLGVVANDVPYADIEKYGFSSAYERRSWFRKLIGR